MPFRCRSRQRVQKFSSSSRYVDPSFFHVLFNETSPTIEYPTVKMLFIIEHSASTFYVSFPPSNPSSRIIIRFCSRTPPLWNLLPRSTLFLVDNSLFFFLPHFSANWRNLGNSNFLASIRSLISMILRGIFKHANRFKNLSKNVRNFNPSLFFIDFAILQ